MLRWLEQVRGVAAQVTCISAVPLALVAAVALRPTAEGRMFDPSAVDMGRSAAMDDAAHVARCSACRLSPAEKAGIPAARRRRPGTGSPAPRDESGMRDAGPARRRAGSSSRG